MNVGGNNEAQRLFRWKSAKPRPRRARRLCDGRSHRAGHLLVLDLVRGAYDDGGGIDAGEAPRRRLESVCDWRQLRVGIIGAGRLGSALAMLSLARGLPRERLLLSTGGGLASLARLRETGLADRVATNEDIVERRDTIVIALRPQALPTLKPLPYVDGRILVSCMAGIPLRCIAAIAGVGVTRAMTSGPDTLLEGQGIAAAYRCPFDSPRTRA